VDREKPEWLESFIRSVFVRFKLPQTAPPLQTYVSLRWSANRFPGHQLVAMNGDQALIPVACRFGELYYSSYRLLIPRNTVASDQWLTTQLDSTWKISEVKQYILTKVFNRSVINNDDLSSRERPVSPITFASGRNSFDSNPEGLLDDDPSADLEHYLFIEPPPRQPRTRQLPTTTQLVTSPSVSGSPAEQSASAAAAAAPLPTHHYSVLVFSTGQLLEDDYSLAWYRLRPHELLEVHPPGTIVRLQRDNMLEYVKPYLELDVRALRVVINDKDSHALGGAAYAQDAASGSSSPNRIRKGRDNSGESRSPPGAAASAGPGTGGGGGLPATPSMRKRKKMKLEWRDRYLVIRQGMLSLFKSRTVSHECAPWLAGWLAGWLAVLGVCWGGWHGPPAPPVTKA